MNKPTPKSEQLMGLSEDHLVPVGNDHFLHNKVLQPFTEMQAAAVACGIDMQICSSFRSFEKQLSIWNRKWLGELPLYTLQNEKLIASELSNNERIHAIMLWSALPGASRHHWGTDFDVYDRASVHAHNHSLALVPSEYENGGPCEHLSKWITHNASVYGFYLPYSKYVGGVACEPWHLSHKVEASKIQRGFVIDELYSHLEQTDILGKESVLKILPLLVRQYTFNLGP